VRRNPKKKEFQTNFKKNERKVKQNIRESRISEIKKFEREKSCLKRKAGRGEIVGESI